MNETTQLATVSALTYFWPKYFLRQMTVVQSLYLRLYHQHLKRQTSAAAEQTSSIRNILPSPHTPMPRNTSKGKARGDITNRSSTTTGSSPSERDMSEQRQSQGESSSRQEDDWSKETDPTKRRRIQNKLAQRKFRERTKQEAQDRQTAAENTERAGYAYSTLDPNELEDHDNLPGVPWGGVSIKHVIEAGRAQEKLSGQNSQAGSSSNLGQGRGSSSR